MTDATPEQLAKVPEFGPMVDAHCPYDEAQLRESTTHRDHHICPVCWTMFSTLPPAIRSI